MRNVVYALLFIALGYGVGYWQYAGNSPAVEGKQNTSGAFARFSALSNAQQSQSGGEEGVDNNVQIQDVGVKSALETISNIEGIGYTDLAQLALSPTVEKVTEIIDGMSRSDISLAINSITGLEREEIEEIGDLHQFSKSLVKTVLRNTKAKVTDNVASIAFGTETNAENEVIAPTSYLSSNAERVYAAFTLPTQTHEKVVVKWFRNAPYALQLMNRYHINKDKATNYVWFRPRNWSKGLYSVEVFAMGSDLELIASGSFEITD